MKKVIVFDFDGTLTKSGKNIWRELWEICGYKTDKTSLYSKLYVSHVINKEITRKQWFDLTCEAFKRKNLNFKQFYEASKQIELKDGFKEVITTLKEKGYSLHIVSGCIKESIEIILGEYGNYFDNIESNRAIFDENNLLKELIPTKFDYEGKAKYINNLIKTGVKPTQIVFIGNSDNDEWAYLTGCKTICINPEKADYKNKEKWHVVKENATSLKELLPEI